jgi:Ankyrin repeats (3 copies)
VVVRLLLDKGANIDTKAKSGETVLHRAVENGHEAVVRLLLEKGANVDTKRPSRRRGRRGPVVECRMTRYPDRAVAMVGVRRSRAFESPAGEREVALCVYVRYR